MFDRILVPLDGSMRSASILPQVRRLLTTVDAEVHLLHVAERGPDPDPVRRGEEFVHSIARARDYLQRVRDGLRADGVRAEADVRAGDPAEKILEFSETSRIALIAMSTHGRTGWSRLTRGSVAERVLRHAPCPVLLLRPEGLDASPAAEPLRFRRILVALDGGEASSRILPLVETIARSHGSEVVLEYAALPIPWLVDEVTTAAPEVPVPSLALDRDRVRLEMAGVPCRQRLDSLSPARAILEAAEEEQADLIALTTHGRTGPSRWAFGSVAEAVLRHATTPILILRTAGPQAGEPITAPTVSVGQP